MVVEAEIELTEFPSKKKSDLLIDLAKKGNREICGFLLYDWSIMKIENIAESDDDFFMHEGQQIQAMKQWGKSIIGVYHSHPDGREEPSTRDIMYAPVQLRYFIVTRDNVLEWDIDGTLETELVWSYHATQASSR